MPSGKVLYHVLLNDKILANVNAVLHNSFGAYCSGVWRGVRRNHFL